MFENFCANLKFTSFTALSKIWLILPIIAWTIGLSSMDVDNTFHFSCKFSVFRTSKITFSTDGVSVGANVADIAALSLGSKNF